jgi:hypothetical protein
MMESKACMARLLGWKVIQGESDLRGNDANEEVQHEY